MLPENTELTIAGEQYTVKSGNSTTYMLENSHGITSFVSHEKLFTQMRESKLAELNSWWSSLPPIEVAGVRLPIARDVMNANELACRRALERSVDAEVEDADEITVAIPNDKILESMQAFEAAYRPLATKWNETKKIIRDATTIEELLAIDV